MSRRQLLAGTGAATVGLALPALSACGDDSSGPSDPSAPADLELWMDIQGEPNQAYFLEHVVGGFKTDYPQVNVNVDFQTGADLRRLIQTALQARSGPDIVRGPSATQTLAWSRANVLEDLTGYAEQFGWSDRVLPWALEAFTFDGKLYALPLRFDTVMLYVNQTLFDEQGWSAPTSREELEGLATEAHGLGLVPFASTNTDWRPASEWYMTMFWNHYSGPDALYQALSGEIPWTDPVFVDAVALINQYFQNGWFGGSVDNYFSVPSQEMYARFGNSEAAMCPQGVWWMNPVRNFFGEAAGNENEWDWVPLPSLRPEVQYPLYEIGIGGSLAVNANSDHPAQSAAFIDWYYDRDRALLRMAEVPATYNIPIPIAEGDLPEEIDPRSARILTSVNEAMATGSYGYVSWTWLPPRTNVYVYEGLEEVVTGRVSPQDYCAELDRLFREEFDAGDVPKMVRREPA